MPTIGVTGVGLRQPHYAQALSTASPAGLAFVEVHSENFFADGGAALQVLQAARERWPVSLHGVGLALGSAAGLDEWHLDRLARLVQRIDPVRVSDHACFARALRRHAGPVVHASDLLPVAFTPASLAIMAANVQRVQDRLARPILVENLSAYLHWADGALAEPDFFNERARRTGCGVLLDVNNLVVNALNEGDGADGPDHAAAVASACRWVDRLQTDVVGEVHLAGYDDSGDLVIDDHGSRVHPPVWQVFAHAARRFGPRPPLVEWDTDLPAGEVLLDEAARAEAVVAQHRVPVAA
ncbi:MAG: DUF692 domain-containing protein [Aquabacterium sp.]